MWEDKVRGQEDRREGPVKTIGKVAWNTATYTKSSILRFSPIAT